MADDQMRDHHRGMAPWVRHYWWVLLIIGAILVVVGSLTQRDLLSIGHPFVLGVLCLLAALGGALQRYRSRRP